MLYRPKTVSAANCNLCACSGWAQYAHRVLRSVESERGVVWSEEVHTLTSKDCILVWRPQDGEEAERRGGRSVVLADMSVGCRINGCLFIIIGRVCTSANERGTTLPHASLYLCARMCSKNNHSCMHTQNH